LTVGSIGSSRIARVLRIAANRSAWFLDNSPFYGYAASSAEALQIARYALDLIEIPEDYAPLMAQDGTLATEAPLELDHDIIFLEIVSRKSISLDQFQISPTLLSSTFADRPILAESLRRYWGPDELRLRRDFLRASGAYEEAGEDEQYLIRHARTAILSDDEILLDLRQIHALIGNRLVIVAPASTTPNDDAAADPELTLTLRLAAGQLGLRLFDPAGAFADCRADYAELLAEGDTTAFLAAFEALYAERLRQEFLAPIRQARLLELEAQATPIARRPTPFGGFPAFFRRAALGRDDSARSDTIEVVTQQQQRHAGREIAMTAAMMGDWRQTLQAARQAIDLGDEDEALLEEAATAAWYLGETSLALATWQARLRKGEIAAVRLLEAAELAFQAGRASLALDWCLAAAPTDPLVARAALWMAIVHDAGDRILDLLQILKDRQVPLLPVAARLPKGSELRDRLTEFAIHTGELALSDPVAQPIVRAWLDRLRAHQAAHRLDAVRELAGRFSALPEDFSGRVAARRALVLTLGKELRLRMAAQNPDTEALVAEILSLEPRHTDALSSLVRTLESRGEVRQAAQVLESLSTDVPDARRVQAEVIRLWMSSDDLDAALASLVRAWPKHGHSAPFRRLRRLLTEKLEEAEHRGATLGVTPPANRWRDALLTADGRAPEPVMEE
jgi:hypothetical protein